MTHIVHPELSYKIMGVLFKVHTELGNRYQEKYYQRAIEEGFKKAKISYKKELPIDLMFEDKKIGKYFLDFLIEDCIVLEVKAIPRFLPRDFKQILAYLISNNLELGILANFRTEKLTYRRVLNSKLQNEHSG